MVALLDSAGCATAGFGLQTAGERLRRDTLKRYELNQQIASTIDLFKKSKIYLYVDILLGIPGQDEAELIDTARFLNKHPPDMILPFKLRYYPRTEIVRIALEKGILDLKETKKIEEGKEYLPSGMDHFFKKKDLNKIAAFVLISKSLPKFLADFVVDKRLYRYSFPLTTLLFHFYCSWEDIYKKMIKGKRQFPYFPLSKQIKFYFYYLLRMFFQRRIFGLSK
jgi:hypothetical protein